MDFKKDKNDTENSKKESIANSDFDASSMASQDGVSLDPPPLQLKASGDEDEEKSNLQADKAFRLQSDSNPILPNTVQTKMEGAFGQDFSNVNFKTNSAKATEAGALAFTQGNDVHFAPGQFKPDTTAGQELIGHELTHIVQQRQGQVKANKVLGKGLAVNDEANLENEADNFGKKAARGESISKYQSIGLEMRSQQRTVQTKSMVMQRAVDTSGGKWDTNKYALRKDMSRGTAYDPSLGVRGIDIVLKFSPNESVDADKLGMTQSVQAVVGGTTSFTDKTKEARAIDSKEAEPLDTGGPDGETDQGTAIDRLHTRNNPIYGSRALNKGETLKDTPMDNNSSGDPTNVGVNATYQLGYRKKAGDNWDTKDAMLSDAPTRSRAAKNSRHIFETTVLAISGNQEGSYYGSVRWGWRTDADGNFTKLPLSVISQGVPSSTFLKAAAKWNSKQSSTGAENADLALVDVKLVASGGTDVFSDSGEISSHLPESTRVKVVDRSHENIPVGDPNTNYTVQRGDTLWGIAQSFYGDGRRYQDIYDANRDKIDDPDLIYPDQEFVIPNAVSVDPLAGKIKVEVVDGHLFGLSAWISPSGIEDERN